MAVCGCVDRLTVCCCTCRCVCKCCVVCWYINSESVTSPGAIMHCICNFCRRQHLHICSDAWGRQYWSSCDNAMCKYTLPILLPHRHLMYTASICNISCSTAALWLKTEQLCAPDGPDHAGCGRSPTCRCLATEHSQRLRQLPGQLLPALLPVLLNGHLLPHSCQGIKIKLSHSYTCKAQTHKQGCALAALPGSG